VFSSSYEFFIYLNVADSLIHHTKNFGDITLEYDKNKLLYIATCMPDGSMDPECSEDLSLPGINRYIDGVRSNYMNASEEKKKEMKEEAISILSDEYKIHLMPSENQAAQIYDRLLALINEGKVIATTSKVKKRYQHIKDGVVFPIIVLYSYGRSTTRKNLLAIKKALGGYVGTNETPRYNKKITSLIYVAGGDGDVKKLFKNSRDNLYQREIFITPGLEFFVGHEL
jgi:hypothetical protein